MTRKPKFVIAATEYVYGDLVVCRGSALGEVVARFPRTAEGDAAAHMFVGFADALERRSRPWSCTPYATDANTANRITKSVG